MDRDDLPRGDWRLFYDGLARRRKKRLAQQAKWKLGKQLYKYQRSIEEDGKIGDTSGRPIYFASDSDIEDEWTNLEQEEKDRFQLEALRGK
jgi:hypothetical protein